MDAVSERTVLSIFHAESTRVCIVHAHTRFVVAQVIASLGVTSCSVQERASVAEKREKITQMPARVDQRREETASSTHLKKRRVKIKVTGTECVFVVYESE